MTTQTILPPRAEIAEKYKWNDTSVFADQAAWQAEFDAVTHALTQLKKYHGALASSPQVLADALDEMQALQKRGWQVFLYASMLHAVDTHDQNAQALNGAATGLLGQMLGAMAFVDPELLAIGKDTLAAWMQQEPRLKI
ncbi:oligoendopeptidase F family protein, partial [Anaerolineae bacterium CFX7]|nr:oligoendopeptidase F family protein [Anaerolineae bacterium CFX7]